MRTRSKGLPPVFPTELEKEIFTLCAISEPSEIPSLMRVAWRVKSWTEPIMWRTVIVDPRPRDPDSEYPVFTWDVLMSVVRNESTRPSSFLHDVVRELSLNVHDHSTQDIATVLSLCTGVQNLSLIIKESQVDKVPPLAALIRSLPLKHLYLDVRPRFCVLDESGAFASLTHLELRNHSFSSSPHQIGSWASSLSRLPSLTHLSFNSHAFLPMCIMVLQTCATLRVLVMLRGYVNEWSFQSERWVALARDGRFVRICCARNLLDWERGARGGDDYWQRAERFIERRRERKVPALQIDDFEDPTWPPARDVE
ncbi:hypothetical protein FB45DRAFT_171681 [Roridomyces roridus]|uniref:Uncharacterized protein n=1 Tax=Roridomyces roridus TaxID=1738132 RepID=A0AAD7FHF4_9AGAR|nr:hypothetical protein FB45DRAFT_171681 [Roridomyces roridus]